MSGDTSSSRRSETTPTRCRRASTDVEIEDHLDVARRLDRLDRLGHRHVFGQREDIRVHDAAGRLLRVLEQVLDPAAFLLAHQLEDGRRQLLGQVVDDGRGVVGRQLLDEAGDLLGGPLGQQRGAVLGPQLGECLHREAAVALDEDVEGGVTVAIDQFGEDLGEVGRVLLLQQVQQIRRRAHAEQPPDRIEHDVEPARAAP